MKKTLIVIDMQNDFITGSLGTKEAQAIVPNVKKKIEEYRARGDEIIFTRDTHYDDYLETNEGKHLPVKHCIKYTHGWEIAEELSLQNGNSIINKLTFGYNGWNVYFDCGLSIIENSVPDEIELVGLCTDICVVSNALILKAMYPEIDITVDASCCAGVTPESHQAALTTMKMCQINVIGE
jgi:nicotinamidase-related amidase